jgi:hypothetical protein
MELGERCCSWSPKNSSSVRKMEDSDGTSLARAYSEKKTKSPGFMFASDVIPHFSLGSRPGACHPISHRRLAKELVILNHKDGSSVAMAVDGGRRLRRKREAWENKRQKRRVQDGRKWKCGSIWRIPPLFILPTERQPVAHDAWCLHPALNLPRR